MDHTSCLPRIPKQTLRHRGNSPEISLRQEATLIRAHSKPRSARPLPLGLLNCEDRSGEGTGPNFSGHAMMAKTPLWRLVDAADIATVMKLLPVWLIVKYALLHLTVTIVAGFLCRQILPSFGVPFSGIGTAHPFVHSLWYAVPGWSAALAVYWLLARRHSEVYWLAAVPVSLLSGSFAIGLLRAMLPLAFQQLRLSELLSSLYWDALVIVIAAALSRRVLIPWPLRLHSQRHESTKP
jgi:hypothetical protein